MIEVDDSNDMEQDSPPRAIVSFDEDETNSNAVVQNGSINQNESNQSLNCSTDTIDEQNEARRTTAAKKQDVLNYFTRQPDGSFKCNLCINSNKASFLYYIFIFLICGTFS